MLLEGKTTPSWWFFFVSLYLASIKPSEREFFVPAGTDLAVKLLTSLVPDHSFFDFSKKNCLTFFLDGHFLFSTREFSVGGDSCRLLP
jgi:hypothetical protein